MDQAAYVKKLSELKAKQEAIEKAWKKREGNKELLEFLIEVVPKSLDAERCSIFILDPYKNDVWVQCGTGLAEKQVSVPTSGSMVGRVIETGKPVVEHDMQEQVGTHDIVAMNTGFVTRNALCIPVYGVTTKRITGAIQILNKKPGMKFSTRDQKLVEKMAFLLQMNIENIFIRQELGRMLVEMQRQIDLLEKKLKIKRS